MICFDTGPIIWGVQGKATRGQEHMVSRTKRYIRYLRNQKQAIMVPTPVVAEYLIPFNPQEQQEQVRVFERGFFIPSFDLPAALVAAELEHDSGLIKAIRRGSDVDRNRLRVDAQILAIAIVNMAEKVITADPHLKSLAQDKIAVTEVPDIHEQPELFEPSETDELHEDEDEI